MSQLMAMASLRQLRQSSPAFYRAVLESERKRIIALVVFVLFFTILKAVRIFVFGEAMNRWGLLAAAFLIAFELLRASQAAAGRSASMHVLILLTPAVPQLCCSNRFVQSSRDCSSPQAIREPVVLALVAQ